MAILSCVAMDDYSSMQWKIWNLSKELASAREETVFAELAQVFIDALLAGDGVGSGQDIRHGGGDFRARTTAVEQREKAQRGLIAYLDRLVPQIGHPDSAPGLPAGDDARHWPLAGERYERRWMQL